MNYTQLCNTAKLEMYVRWRCNGMIEHLTYCNSEVIATSLTQLDIRQLPETRLISHPTPETLSDFDCEVIYAISIAEADQIVRLSRLCYVR